MRNYNNTNRMDARVPMMNSFEATRAMRAIRGRSFSGYYTSYGMNANIVEPTNACGVSRIMARYK